MTKAAACCSLALVAWSGSHSFTSAFVRPGVTLHSRLSPRATAVFDSCGVLSVFRSTNNILSGCRMSSSSANNEASVEIDVAGNLDHVRQKIQTSCDKSNRSVDDVRLVAVSKTKPLELLQVAYKEGFQCVFGENYVQELVEKAGAMPNDVEWHFIGSLQSNKANVLVKSVVPVSAKLTVETVASMKLANKLNNAMSSLEDIPADRKLSIFVQVNTSGEDSKSGIEPNEAAALCKDISQQCDRLEIQGLMTIGAPGDLGCFDALTECRDKVAAELGIDKLELSMGMSGDYEAAVERGATNVRVGSTVFGARDYSNKN